MAFKYVHVFGDEYLPGFAHLYALGHVPLDNIMLGQFDPGAACAIKTNTWHSNAIICMTL